MLKNSQTCHVIITGQYSNQVSSQYGANVEKFLDAHKYSKHGIGQKLRCNNCKEQFIGKHVLEMYQRS